MKRISIYGQTLAVLGALLTTNSAFAEEDSDADLLKELESLEADEEKPAKSLDVDQALENVVVTATKKQQTIAAGPAIIAVVAASRIKAMGYRTVAEAVQSLPGFYLLNDHVNWNAGIRGVNGGQRASSRILKSMIDGQPVSYRPNGSNWLGEEMIPIDAVLRIEVIRGPASALYGANAFFGVINIITKPVQMLDGGKVSGRVGAIENNLTAGGSLIVGKKGGDVDVLVAGTGSFADRSGMEISNLPEKTTYAEPNNKSKDDTSIPASLYAKIGYQSEDLGLLRLDVSYQRLMAHGEFQDWGPLIRGLKESPASHEMNLISAENLFVRGRLVRPFLEDFSVSITTTFADMGPTDADHVKTNETGVGDYYTRDVGTTSLDFQGELSYNYKDVNSVTLGADYTLDFHELQTFWGHSLTGGHTVTPNRGDVGSDKRLWNLGAYLQGIVHPFQIAGFSKLDKLGLTVGFRYDRQNIYGDAFNYRAGAVYLWRKFGFKALFGTSYKAPAAAQLFTGQLRVTKGVIANPELKPERAKTIEFQGGGEILPGFTAWLTGFYNIMDDKVELIEDPITRSNVNAQNVAAVRGLGIEADLGYKWKGLQSWVNFSYQKSTVSGENRDDRDTDLFPTMMAKFGAMYSEPRFHIGASVEGQYIGSVLSSAKNAEIADSINEIPYEISGYFIMNLALFSVDLKFLPKRETFLHFKVANLTGTKYIYPGFGNYDIPALGRSYMFTLTQDL